MDKVYNRYKQLLSEWYNISQITQIVNNEFWLKYSRPDALKRRMRSHEYKNGIDEAKQVQQTTDIKSEIYSDIETKNKKNEVDAINKKYKSAVEQIEQLEWMLAIANDVQWKKYSISIKKLSNKRSESVPILVLSDWHVEEVVDPKTVRWLNEYNPSIAEDRAKAVFRNALKVVESQRSGVEINTMVIAVLWDMISGYIHEELQENNAMSPTEAIVFFMALMEAGIKYILDNSDLNLKIVCNFGNHGRTTEKKRVSTGAKNSYEWLAYKMLEKLYINNDRVSVVVADWYFNEVYVFNHLIRFHHGDDFKFWWGVWGITIPINKQIHQWNIAKPAYLDIFWHFHQLSYGRNFLCNGSLIGYGPYAQSIGAWFEEPQQGMVFINSEYGKTIFTPIFCK